MARKSKVLDLLKVSSEDEAVEMIKSLAVPPMAITIVADATGGISVGLTGNPPRDVVESVMMKATQLIMKTPDAPQGNEDEK